MLSPSCFERLCSGPGAVSVCAEGRPVGVLSTMPLPGRPVRMLRVQPSVLAPSQRRPSTSPQPGLCTHSRQSTQPMLRPVSLPVSPATVSSRDQKSCPTLSILSMRFLHGPSATIHTLKRYARKEGKAQVNRHLP